MVNGMNAEQGTNPPERLTTERLILRKPSLEDAHAIFESYAQDPEVARYLTWKPADSVEETICFLQGALRSWESRKTYTWMITRKGEDRAIGAVDARVEIHANIGYVLARPYWNRGIMTEAVRAVVEWAMAQEEIIRVWAVCDVENVASARVLEKVGMQREGILRRWILLPNRSDIPRDCYCYAIVK